MRNSRPLTLGQATARRVAIGGDLFLGGQLTHYDAGPLVQSGTFDEAELRILNLEQPISDRGTPEPKSVLYTGSAALEKLRQLRLDAVTLANNHIHDMGAVGISDTLEFLDADGIGWAGAGRNSSEAARPYQLSETLYLLSFCQFDAPTLRQVKPATPTSPGMNPLELDRVLDCLGRLPRGARAILYFHWGQEHLWLPAPDQIALCERLLADDRVALIVGTHPHRIQGYLERHGKRAYFCIGNFLFPNFMIAPPAVISNEAVRAKGTPVTRRYHSVRSPTWKKWLLVNRISLVVNYDVATGRVSHSPHYQLDDRPVVRELSGVPRSLVNAWVGFLSLLLRLPRGAYELLHKGNAGLTTAGWRVNIIGFRTKTEGVRWLIGRIAGRLLGRISP